MGFVNVGRVHTCLHGSLKCLLDFTSTGNQFYRGIQTIVIMKVVYINCAEHGCSTPVCWICRRQSPYPWPPSCGAFFVCVKIYPITGQFIGDCPYSRSSRIDAQLSERSKQCHIHRYSDRVRTGYVLRSVYCWRLEIGTSCSIAVSPHINFTE